MLNNKNAQPPILEQAAANIGFSFENIELSQLIHAAIEYSYAKIHCYDKDEAGIWHLNNYLGIISGFAGKNGVSSFKKEGDGCTPAGLFRLGCAFGNNDKPETKMAYKKVTADSFWVDDPSSRLYNTWVEGTENADWSSAEHLSIYKDSYAYAVVVEYNTAPTLNEKGSAIFLHCGNKPTAGCIAVPEELMLKILQWLDPEKTPGILVSEG